MRAREFIIEYDRGMTLKSWQQKLTARMSSDNSAPDTIDEIMEIIESSDPTRNKVYVQWIVKRYVAGDFTVDLLDQVNQQLSDYDKIKKSLNDPIHRDINRLTYAQLPDIINLGQTSKSQPKFEIIPDTEVLYNGPEGQLAVPKTEEASRALGAGTAWCTAWTDQPTMFNHYNSSGKLYTWRAKNGDKAQFYWGNNIQFMNSANRPLEGEKLHFYRSVNPATKKLFAKYESTFINNGDMDRIRELDNILSEAGVDWTAAHTYIKDIQYAESAYNSISAGDFDDFPEIAKAMKSEQEASIAKSAKYSYKYASEILKTPFPAGEPAIATSPPYAYRYATFVLNQTRFPAGEAAIATSPQYAYRYAVNIYNERFLIGEAAIATDPRYAAWYDAAFGTNLAQR